LILVDTSVWIDHLHKPIPRLVEALEHEEVLTHPFIIGELACGEIRKRREFLDLLSMLPSGAVATDDETLHFIEHHRLMGKGLSYVDAHLLASATLTETSQLWTNDKRLAEIAAKLRIGFQVDI